MASRVLRAEPDVLDLKPAAGDTLAELARFIEAHQADRGKRSAPTLFLSGTDEHDRVALPDHLHAILEDVVAALSEGRSISILTRDREITTQDAAEILGVSRPTLVRLIDTGELPAHVPGRERRKLRLADVLAYREELRRRRNEFITQSAERYSDAAPDEVATLVSEARKRCAEWRN